MIRTRVPRYPFRSMRRALVAACLLLASCSNIEKATPRPTTANSTVVSNPNDVDPIMRGTVASEAVLIGFEDVIVRGYGLVVGLSGTGSRAMPAEVRALLLQEIARRDVADTTTGMGISPENLPHIFDRFWRGDKSRARTEGNSGLGLAIARQLILAHNGTLTVKSDEGKGTTFVLELPA